MREGKRRRYHRLRAGRRRSLRLARHLKYGIDPRGRQRDQETGRGRRWVRGWTLSDRGAGPGGDWGSNGTRFIATQESDFEQGWKDLLVSATEEDTLVARGFFGPMRFLRNPRSIELVDATVRGAPDLFKGIPTGSSQEILDLEIDGLENLFKGKLDATPILSGVVAGRIHDIPKVGDLLDGIIAEAESVLEEVNSRARR